MESYIGLIAFVAGLSVLLAAYALISPKEGVKKRSPRRTEDTPTGDGDSISRYVRPMLGEFTPSMPGMSNLSDNTRDNLSKLIIRSGNPWNLRVEELRGTQVLFAFIGAAIGLVLAPLALLPVPWWILVPVIAIVGYVIPYSVYNSARESREKDIRKQLPEALDLLVITMSSGLTFEPAFASVTKKMPAGLLQEEFATMSGEIQSGRTVEATMTSFAERAASDEAQSFAKAVVSAQRQGADMSEVLTGQAENARDAYEGLVDTKIAKLSTMMFAFLVPTMLPALMILFLAPSLVDLMGAFG